MTPLTLPLQRSTADAEDVAHEAYGHPLEERFRAARAEHAGPLLSVIVPTFNERDNVQPMIDELTRVLRGIEWEAIFVDDDSPDGTASEVRRLACEHSSVRCVHRIGRRGLSSACIEGMLASSAPYVAVMDGDLQHDPSILPQMLEQLEHGDAELVVGSRYVGGGGVGDWNAARRAISAFATRVGRAVVPDGLHDPMSGFFALRRSLLEEVVRDLSGLGFKILLDIVASARHPVSFRELPFVFRQRTAGVSKLDTLVAWEYAMLLADKLIGRYVPVRFLAFAAIGGLGVFVHLAVLTLAFRVGQLGFVGAQALAVCVSMLFNYSINNVLTYRDRRRRGWRWFSGFLSFAVACSVGAAANVGVAAYLFSRRAEWVLAAVAGVLVGAVWNYAVTSVYTWGKKTR
ncbi:MAG: glycosyltransferase family 2 protein [Gammaproteobacteria bacterium]